MAMKTCGPQETMLLSLLVLMASACSPGRVTLESGTSDSDSESTSETSSGTSSESEPEPVPDPEPCGCVVLDEVCGSAADEAMFDCELLSPCGTVNGDGVAAECVLQLLVDQEPARFRYNLDNPDDTEGWIGWFYILGPGIGIDNECHREGWDFGIERTPAAAHFGFEEPAYFADCIGESASVMTGCIFNGLNKGGAVAECPG